MGLTEPALYDADEELARTLARRPDARRHARAAASEGWVRLTYPTPFVPFADGFPTPSGRLEFYSERAAARTATTRCPANAAARRPRPATAPAGADRPRLALVPEHDLRQQARPAADAPASPRGRAAPRRRRRARAGDRRRACGCSTRAASFVAECRGRRPRPRRGVVASTKGHWLKHIRGGANVNATVEERDADMGGGAVFHDCSVWVRSAA